MTRDEFVTAISERYQARAEIAKHNADEMAEIALVAFLEGENLAYGEQTDLYSWNTVGAHEIADTDMSYWEG